MMLGSIRYEQAVYGSFPFWSRGYGILAASAGCLPEWKKAMCRACQNFGEAPSNLESFRSVFALPLDRSRWMVVQATSNGCDDQGRPSALHFHALFVSSWSYRLAGAGPLSFDSVLRDDWGPQDQDAILPQGRLKPGKRRPDPGDEDPRVDAIVDGLNGGRRVVVHSARPADELFRQVWDRLSGRLRRRTSTATWTFSLANDFDCAATPRLSATLNDGFALVVPDLPRSIGRD